ncbi:MAG: hypothetical protein R3F13_12270 [Prosthecobacter sp.]
MNLFTTPGRVITLDDVLHAAELRGDVPTEQKPRPMLDAAAAECASEDWRIEKNLIAGEELDVWLALRNITHDDFLRHFRGEAPANDAQRLARWWIDGSITRWATRHAHGIAALAAQNEPLSGKQLADFKNSLATRLGGADALNDWLLSHERDAEWVADLAQIETAHEICRESLLRPESLAKELRTQHFPLHRVQLVICQVPQEGTARELMLQLGQGASTTLAQHAERLGFHHFPQSFFIGDLAPAFQQPFLSARAGECLAPMQARDHWRVCQLVEKTPPTLDDPEVLSRVQKRVVEEGFAERCEGVIAWRVE